MGCARRTLGTAALVGSMLILAPSRVCGQHKLSFTCGENCFGVATAHCNNALRVRVTPTIDGQVTAAEGALREPCPTDTPVTLNGSSITNGRLTATWEKDNTMSFSRDGVRLFASTPNGLGFTSLPPPPTPSPPPPQTCGSDCTDSVVSGHDVASCSTAGIINHRVANTTAAGCCAACHSTSHCAAFAYGTDSADPAHRRVCFLCSGFSGFTARGDRDAGCVVRGGGEKSRNPSLSSRAPFAPQRFVSTYGEFSSDSDEVVVGLGQHSAVGHAPCSGGKGCGQYVVY